MITVTVPGKIHLLGEHSVVHGKPALLAAINLRLSVKISPSPKNSSSRGVNVFNLGGESGAVPRDFLKFKQKIEAVVKKQFKLESLPLYSVTIKSDIPIGAGLGSSAALSAAFTAALLTFLKLPNDKKTVYEIAYEGEKFFHGNPSGGDLAAVVNGGFTYFRKEFEFLKTFSKLPFVVHKNIKQFYLIDSGKPIESTKELVVDVVGSFVKKNKKLSQEIFDDQEQFVKDMVVALKDGDEETLIRTIKSGQLNLEQLGVVGKKAKKIIRSIEKSGGAAKIIGGGGIKEGAGMILAYFKTKPKDFEFKLIPVTIEQKGVIIHE